MPKYKHKLPRCLNCHFPFKNEMYDNYCPNCGQKNSDNQFTFFEIFKEFSTQLVAFDSKFARSIYQLVRYPGNLTEKFNGGNRVRYTNPVRMLLVCSVLFFALLSITSKLELTENGIVIKESNLININQGEDSEEEETVEEIQLEIDEILAEIQENDSLMQMNKPLGATEEIFKGLRDGFNKSRLENLQEKAAKDSINKEQNIDSPDEGEIDVEDSIFFSSHPEYRVALKMMMGRKKYTVQEVLDSTKIQNPIVVHGMHQLKKLQEDEQSSTNLSKYFIQQISFMILILIPFSAFFLKVFYIRNRIIYLDHLVFLIHFHSLSYLILSIGVIVSFFGYEFLYFIATIPFFLYWSIRKVYKQGIFKSILKIFLLFNGYSLLISLGIVITLIFSFFFF